MSDDAAPRAGAREVTAWAQRMLHALGATPENARIVSESLVDADLRGYAGHGVSRLPDYADAVRSGRVDPSAAPVALPSAALAVGGVDGRDGFGHVTALAGVELVASIARERGIGAVALRRCHHVGRLGRWVGMLAEQGLVGHMISQGEPWVAAPGGRTRMLGTNPFAYALPAREGPPVVVDFATSATSVGSIASAAAAGRSVPPDVLLDARGEPTRDPSDLFDGGMLLPLAGHKGFGLALVADLWAGAAGGGGPASGTDYSGHHGVLILAADPALWPGPDRLADDVEAVRAALGPDSTVDSAPRLPGERSVRARREHIERGLSFDASRLAALDDLAADLGVEPLFAHLSS